MRSNPRRWSLAWTTYSKLAVVSSFDRHHNPPHFTHICLNCIPTVSQALKIGDNNVIESKGEACAFPSVWAWISEENRGTLLDFSNHINSLLSSWCWEECDAHQRLHHRSLLPGQHLWSHSWEYCHLWFWLYEAGPDGETTGSARLRPLPDAELPINVAFSCFTFFFFLSAPDASARLSDEDFAELSPFEENSQSRTSSLLNLCFLLKAHCKSLRIPYLNGTYRKWSIIVIILYEPNFSVLSTKYFVLC